jgi:cob(I)alamin adenosyltransferase
VEALTAHVHRLERVDGILLDWAIPGEQTAAAALDVARTTCRRAERTVVRLSEAGEVCDKNMVAYLNRLADLLWLLSRFLERDVAADARLRADKHDPARWSRAW